jgi:nitrate reductase NapE component
MLVPSIFAVTIVATYSAIVWMFSPHGDIFF